MGLYPEEIKEIQGLIQTTENEARALISTWFPDVVTGVEMHSWRFSLTTNEPLHFDVYADHIQKPVIRLFVNLDSEPRLWDIGRLATSPTDGVYDGDYYKFRTADGPSERFAFQPGAAWMVDSRRVAHAIIYGRRAAMFSWET